MVTSGDVRPKAGRTALPADEVDALGDVAPLVAAAELQLAVVAVVELQEVPRLQEHVAELGERQGLFPLLQPGPDRFLADHLVDAEELADVAQEVEQAGGAEPLGVVDQEGAGVSPASSCRNREIWAATPARLASSWSALSRLRSSLLPLGSPIMPGPSADQGDRTVAGLLEPAQQAELLEVADVQAVGGRIEADIEHHPGPVDAVGQGVRDRSTGEPDPAS